MVIKLLQQSTFRRYAAIVLSPFFYFCCFRCVIVPLTGVINYVFCIYVQYQPSIRLLLKSTRVCYIAETVHLTPDKRWIVVTWCWCSVSALFFYMTSCLISDCTTDIHTPFPCFVIENLYLQSKRYR